MPKPIERTFVGDDRPLLHSLRDHLASLAPTPHGAAPDYSSLTVVLPGARAGRRLLELLVMSAAPGAVIPPRILTLGAWLSLGLRPSRPPAGTIARLAAWAGALASLDSQARRAIIDTDNDTDDDDGTVRRLSIARMLDSAKSELAAEGLRFADALRLGAVTPDFADAARWEALALAQDRYAAALDSHSLADADLDRLSSIETGRIDPAALHAGGRVILAGISDMPALARRVIDHVADRCVALVAAPGKLAGRFDPYGCVLPDAWEHARIDLPDAAIIGAEGPGEQAGETIRALAGIGDNVPADQVTIGTPDPEVRDHLERLAGRLGTLPVRRAEGDPVAFTRPIKLLLAVADHLERRDFDSFAALVRHADAERRITRILHDAGHDVRVDTWLAILDDYQVTHVHTTVDGAWHTDDPDTLRLLSLLDGAVNTLLAADTPAPLTSRARLAPPTWSPPLRALLGAVFPPDTDEPTLEACRVIDAILTELTDLPPALAADLALTPGELIRLVIREAGAGSIPQGAEHAAVDLVGWLELATDDAPWMFITGLNEGIVPAPSGMDPLLPEGLRRTLGLRDRRARLARDAHALSLIVHSRPAGRCRLLFGRRSGAGDPLSPSRLLLMCPDDSLLHRVRLWTEPGETPAHASQLMLRCAPSSGFRLSPRLLPAHAADLHVTEMSVTSFRAYLDSPYGFYLTNVLRLSETADGAVEMDALGFGTLVHDVLKKLTRADLASSTDPDALASFLLSTLDATARLLFGDSPRPEVWLQLEQAKARLTAFAHAQARRAAEGWRIAHTEWDPGRRVAHLMVDNTPMYLRGRIDRIDIRDSDGAWAVLDYKTGNKPPAPTDARAVSGAWRDLQLPLYRHLAASLGLAGAPSLGWIALPSDVASTGFVIADWEDHDLADADSAAADIVRRVRNRQFDSFGPRPPGNGIVGWLCGGLRSEEDDQ